MIYSLIPAHYLFHICLSFHSFVLSLFFCAIFSVLRFSVLHFSVLFCFGGYFVKGALMCCKAGLDYIFSYPFRCLFHVFFLFVLLHFRFFFLTLFLFPSLSLSEFNHTWPTSKQLAAVINGKDCVSFFLDAKIIRLKDSSASLPPFLAWCSLI